MTAGLQTASGPAEVAASNRALKQSTDANGKMAAESHSAEASGAEVLLALRLLEGRICDLVRLARIADTIVEETLRFDRSEPAGDRRRFTILSEDLEDIAFLLGETRSRARDLDDAFHAALRVEAAR